ncbi:MAG: PASTA domain-containing protein [Bdellovibrio sp.]|nr:MAG: PASTA domain-containing protein [Bdellovibrio sp.]
MKARIVYIFLFFFCLWAIILGRGLQLQIFPDQKLLALKKRQFKKFLILKSRRGSILDRNQKDLAVTVASYSLFADPFLIKNKKKAAKKIARVLGGISYRKILKKIRQKQKRFVWIKRSLSKGEADKIRKHLVRGFSFVEEPLRIYPNNNLLSQVLGFVGRDNRGLEGLELEYDNFLRGHDKRLKIRRDARGRPLIINGQVFLSEPEGGHIILTIDSDLQFFLEKELQETFLKYNAKSAMGMVLDVQTGEILAMGKYPGYNLNHPTHYSPSLRRNVLVTDAIEQGSTIKTFIVAAALKYKTAFPSKKYNIGEGVLKIGRRKIRDAHRYKKPTFLSLEEILSHSSNVGIAKVAFELGQNRVYQILKDFGFGQKTGIQFPGEGKGILRSPPWGKHLFSNISFGQGMTATPLQIAAAYAAIANGGILYRPYLIKGYVDPVTSKKTWVKPTKLRRVLDENTAFTLKLMLNGVTAEGATGHLARIEGYPVAGKTGTAQKVDFINGGYKKKAYFSSFVGFFPVNRPKYLVYVAVDEPWPEYYASTVAVPVFSKIARYIIRKNNLLPSSVSLKNLVLNPARSKKNTDRKRTIPFKESGRVPQLKGLSLREALSLFEGVPVRLKVKGTGRVYFFSPKVDSPLHPGDDVVLYLSSDSKKIE